MDKKEIEAIMSLAKKILQEQDKIALEVIRKSEDQHDMTDYSFDVVNDLKCEVSK
tara:strand:+ start:205 stop:369 length:165 start_codon:yes stop_codon:yes gene_type:complete